MSNRLARYGAVLASALLFSLYTRVEQPWALLGWVALVPWLLALERERSTWAVLWSGALMAAAFTLAVFAWFATAVARYTDLSPLLTFALLIASAPLLQPQFLFFAALRRLLAARGFGRAVTAVGAACAWVGAEWLCPRLFGDTIGHGLLAFPTLRQGADLAGAAGLTVVVLTVNECVCAAVRTWPGDRRTSLRALASAACLIIALSGYGFLRVQQVRSIEPAQQPLAAALVQANLSDYAGLRTRLGSFGAVRQILDTHERLSGEALEPVELLVWPETVYPTTFGKPKSPDGASFDERIKQFSAHSGAALLFGAYDRSDDREYNAAILLQPDDDARIEVYRKRRLFPLTEELPAWLDRPFVRERLPWLGTWRAGDGPHTLVLRRRDGDQLRIAPLVCLDAVDPALAIHAARSGADLIVAMSNDGWFAGTRGARLHLVVSAFRSIETRLPQLRATNTGISAAITATGEIVAHTALSAPAVLTANVQPGRRGSTLMLRWGDWFGRAAAALAFALAAMALRRQASEPAQAMKRNGITDS